MPGYITHVHTCECHTSYMTHVEYLILYGSVSIICQQDCHQFMVTLLSSYVQWSGPIIGLGRDNISLTVMVTLMIDCIQQQYYTEIGNENLLFQAGGDAYKYIILQLHV